MDAANFEAGDVIRITEWSPATPASPTEWQRTVLSVAGNAITLTSSLSSPAWDTTKKYVIQFASIADVQTSQRISAFIADDADDSTGLATSDSYQWGGTPPFVDGTIAYTNRFVRYPTTVDDEGRPVSVHTWADTVNTLNNLLSYTTSNHVLQDFAEVERTCALTTGVIVYGPVWVPLYGHTRSLTVRIFGRHSTAVSNGTFKVYASASPIVTNGSYVPIPPTDGTSVTFTTNSTTNTWLSEQTLTVYPTTYSEPPGVWIGVIATSATGPTTVYFAGISAREAALS